MSSSVPSRRISATKLPNITSLRNELGYGNAKLPCCQVFCEDTRVFRQKFVTNGIRGHELHDWKSEKHQSGLAEMTTDYLDKKGNGTYFWPDDESAEFYNRLQYSKHKDLIHELVKCLFFRLNQQQFRNNKYKRKRGSLEFNHAIRSDESLVEVDTLVRPILPAASLLPDTTDESQLNECPDIPERHSASKFKDLQSKPLSHNAQELSEPILNMKATLQSTLGPAVLLRARPRIKYIYRIFASRAPIYSYKNWRPERELEESTLSDFMAEFQPGVEGLIFTLEGPGILGVEKILRNDETGFNAFVRHQKNAIHLQTNKWQGLDSSLVYELEIEPIQGSDPKGDELDDNNDEFMI